MRERKRGGERADQYLDEPEKRNQSPSSCSVAQAQQWAGKACSTYS